MSRPLRGARYERKRVAAAVVIAGLVGATVGAHEPDKVGQVRFPVSCRAAVQKPFERAAPHAGYPKPA